MKMKTVATCSPLLLCLVAGAARADLEPFSFDASETVKHHSNILHDDDRHTADWLSTTELKAALNQEIGRERLIGAASVNLDRYAKFHNRSSVGYSAKGEFDWETIGDLSGALGADSRRHEYLDDAIDSHGLSAEKNLQTDNHAFANIRLGGPARWSIFSGFDASERKFSDSDFRVDNVRQWAASGGTSYSTSPDLSFGLHGRYVRGKYPENNNQGFSVKTLGVNTRWTITGNTAFDGNVGYTRQRTDGEADQHFVNGALNLRWTPPSHFTVILGASRDSSTNTGAGATVTNTNDSVTGRSLNTIAHLDVSYALTAKITLDSVVQFIHRQYTDAHVPTGLSFGGVPLTALANGSSNTTRYTLSAHYLPTRTTALGCGFSRDVHAADQSISGLFKPYTDNTVMCTASIHFD